jgi:hypothetical protein
MLCFPHVAWRATLLYLGRPDQLRSPGAIATVLALAMLWACAPSVASRSSVPSPTTIQVSPTPVPAIGALGAAGCRPISPSGAFTGEVYGTATGGTVWAWFMASYPPQASIEDKTLWRREGPGASGAPTFALVGPASQTGRLNWGPQRHSSSTWNRPGLEFGTGLLFPAAGCWDVHVTVGQLTGDVYVVVS